MIWLILSVALLIIIIFFVVRASKSSEDDSTRIDAHTVPPAREVATPADNRPAGDALPPVKRSEYMEHGAELPYFEDDRRVRLLEISDWLALVTDDMQIVNPRSTQLYRAGVYSFKIRGTSYYERAVTQGDFSPGTMLTLVREPDNEFDPNAVAIYAPGVTQKAGYVNKMNARRLAPMFDQGDDLVAVSLRGDGPGSFDIVPHILVADRTLVEQLLGGGPSTN